MATNFFERQDQARNRTFWLVLYLSLAVLSIITVTYFFVSYILGITGAQPAGDQLPLFVIIALVTLGVVGLGCLYKIVQLNDGGKSIAERLGGKQIHYDSGGLVEKRLLNVVQEMALASGVSAPPVYILEESGINAFAAGYSVDDAVIGVTRGAAERLSRSELQGVIAHEFSHILNGDMRLNIRLIGVVHGILVIGLLGYYIFRSGFHTTTSSRRSSSAVWLILLGLGILIIGYTGTFFGNLIKSAVNRQREYLADASAVQFTRNPDGLAGALMSIGGYSKSGTIIHQNADEASHMFFSRAISDFRMLFSTHPPLEERIKKLKPEWEGDFQDANRLSEDQLEQELNASHAGVSGLAGSAGRDVQEKTEPQTRRIDEEHVSQIGGPTEKHLAYAQKTLNELSRPLRQALGNPYEARGLVFALLIHPNEHDREKQMDILRDCVESHLLKRVKLFVMHLDETSEAIRLPLLELSLPELRSQSPAQREDFLTTCRKLIETDENVELFEWSMFKILNQTLSPEEKKSTSVTASSLDDLTESLRVVLMQLAVFGHEDEEKANQAFWRSMKKTRVPGTSNAGSLTQHTMKEFTDALEELQDLRHTDKEKVIRSCVACIESDGRVTVREGELLRVICALLDCPMPPILSDDGTS